LSAVTSAINEGAVFRFLTKPWDDEKLRQYIKEAFQYKQLSDNNLQLSLKVRTTNHELATANRQLADLIDKKQNQIAINQLSFNIVREALQHTPAALIGVDDSNVIAFVNDAAINLFGAEKIVLGDELQTVFLELSQFIDEIPEKISCGFNLNGNLLDVRWHKMGVQSQSSGRIIIIG
jgi:PAS domain-containing protein